MAVAQRRPERVVHHSNRGSQYTSIAFGLKCHEYDVVPSMGSVGDCYDNTIIESCFATLELEISDRNDFTTRAQARTEVISWIEGWYNPDRRHSSINYLSPTNTKGDADQAKGRVHQNRGKPRCRVVARRCDTSLRGPNRHPNDSRRARELPVS